MRSDTRYRSNIPVRVSQDKYWSLGESLLNVSSGGLSFVSGVPYVVGSEVKITISAVSPKYEAQAKICWCEAQEEHFEIGAKLLTENDAFSVRMAEQVCHIEHYKRQVFLTEGRELSSSAAASEWINKFAEDFPALAETG